MIPRAAFAQALRPVANLQTPLRTLRLSPVHQPLKLDRPWRVRLGAFAPRRWESTVTGDEKSGHIVTAQNESILFFDNLFPLKLTYLLRRPFQPDLDVTELLKRFENSSLGIGDPIKLVKRAIPSSLPVKVTEIVPRIKDGGAFVKFSHGAELAPKDIEEAMTATLKESPQNPWFNPFRPIKAGLVKGIPWLEDLSRFPKNRVKVEFVPKEPGLEAVELSQETLFSLFRRYGKIAEITSQPPDSKTMPRFAYLDFALIRDAIMARNCLHGFVLPEAHGGGKHGTKLQLSYEQRIKAHTIWNWLTSHPRLVIPVIAALVAAITVVIFDPIRQFFVKAHVQHSFKLTNNRLYRWFKSRTSDFLAFARKKSDKAGLDAVWNHRRDLIDQVQVWLEETSDTFIVVQGPRGSGKKELVLDQSLKGRKNVLVVDCKPIVEARGESGTIKHLASAVGYRPIFSWANSLSSLVDLAVQSTTGVKSGFSETLESQVVKILQTAAAALKEVSLSGRNKNDKDAALSEDAFLEAHPERRAVIVVDNFLHRSDDSHLVYDKLAEWAAALVQNNIAHVIFLTDDTSYSKSLSKALPDRVFRQVALGDLSPDVAKTFILSRLEEEEEEARAEAKAEGQDQQSAVEKVPRPDLAELDTSIGILGGRLTDLEALARRLKGGQSPKRAVEEIVDQSASEIVKMFLLGSSSKGGNGASEADKKWSTEQVWHLIRALAEKGSLRYNEVLLSNTFASSTTAVASSGEAALESLSNAELITVKSTRGRPTSITAGKPMYQAAFKVLVSDAVLKAKLDLAVLSELAKIEAKSIEKLENELALLGGLPRQPPQTAGRVDYLLSKLDASQAKITGFETEMAALKKVLSSRF